MSFSSQEPSHHGDQQESRFPSTAPGQASGQVIGGPPQWSPPPPKRGSRAAALIASGIALMLVVVGLLIATRGSSTPKIPAAASPITAQALRTPAATPLAAFTLPAYYTHNALVSDPGCAAYDAAWTAFGKEGGGGEVATMPQEIGYIEGLGSRVGAGASVAQDPTLAGGLRAEAVFFQAPANAAAIAQASLDSAARSNAADNPELDTAMKPITATDTYLGAVCGYAG